MNSLQAFLLTRHVERMRGLSQPMDVPQTTAVMQGLARAGAFPECLQLLDDLATRHLPLNDVLFHVALKVRVCALTNSTY